MLNEPVQSFKRDAPLQLPAGNTFTRLLTARAIAAMRRSKIEDVVASMWPNDRVLSAVIETRATSASAMTSVSGWAAELAHKVVYDTVEALGAASSAMDVMRESVVVSWDGAGQITVPAFVGAATNAGFVQEGNPIPVRQLAEAPAVINPFKIASIAVLTREMMESSNAERLISDALVTSAALAIDAVFFSTAAATAAAPAGIRNGISTLTASANTDAFGAVFEDVAALINSISQVGGKGPYVIAGGAGRIVSMSGRYDFETKGTGEGGDVNMFQVMTSAAGNDLIAIAPKAIASAISPEPDIEVVNAATLVMDTAPGAAGTTGSGEKSMWQTDSLAIKVRWPVSWVVRNVLGVAWLTPAWK
jgi:hypothetical protein